MDSVNNFNYFSIICPKYDKNLLQFDCDWLTQVRKDFFVSGKKQKNKIIKEYSGKIFHYSYVLEPNKPMRWKRMQGDKVLEKSRINDDGSYDILSFDNDRFITKIMYFDSHHNIKKIEYFCNNEGTRKKVLTLNINKDEFFVTEYKNSINHTVSYKVYPVSFDLKNYNFEIIDNKFTAFLCLTPRGTVTYCTKEQLIALENMKKSETNVEKESKTTVGKNMGATIPETTVDTSKTAESSDCGKGFACGSAETATNCSKDFACGSAQTAATDCSKDFAHCSAKTAPATDSEKNIADNLTYRKIIKTENNEKFYYFGQMNSNLRNGYGFTISEKCTPAYVGGYLNDKKDGFGVFCNQTGEICYVGGFKQDKKHNLGIIFDKSQNKIIIKNFQNGTPVSTIAEFDENGNILCIGKTEKSVNNDPQCNIPDSQLSFDTTTLT